MKLYHATARPNLKNIRLQGLRINQRGNNDYGLDAGVDYTEIYPDSDQPMSPVSKPVGIHLTSDLTVAKFYKDFITESHAVPAVILIIEIDEPAYRLEPDSEDKSGICCLTDISASCITELLEYRQLFFAIKCAPVSATPYVESNASIAWTDSDNDSPTSITQSYDAPYHVNGSESDNDATPVPNDHNVDDQNKLGGKRKGYEPDTQNNNTEKQPSRPSKKLR